ncbi:hypothetical protein FB451DRAFT_1292401 [Mycena latifolia]|nr:hypothetical protein FB451DRAFT_1292401 [Mycena latifolia]
MTPSAPSVTKPSPAASGKPRPRSPPSMYGGYDKISPKAPKPLIKLDKKPKANPEDRPKAEVLESPQRTPFLRVRLRRKTKTGALAAKEGSARAAPSEEPYAIPARPMRAVHPIALAQTSADKAARRLGENPMRLQIAPDNISLSDLLILHRTSAVSAGDGEHLDPQASEGFADDSYCLPGDTESEPVTPIEFLAPSAPGFQSKPASDVPVVGWANAVTESMEEERWMGAWNEDDMQAVIHKLRSLK